MRTDERDAEPQKSVALTDLELNMLQLAMQDKILDISSLRTWGRKMGWVDAMIDNINLYTKLRDRFERTLRGWC